MTTILRTIVLDWSAQTEEEYEKTKMLVGTLASACANRWLAASKQVPQEKSLTPYGIVQTLDYIVGALGDNCKSLVHGVLRLQVRSFLNMNGWELNIQLKNGYIQPFLIYTDLDEHRIFIETMFKTALERDRELPLTLVEQKRIRSEVPQTVATIVFANQGN